MISQDGGGPANQTVLGGHTVIFGIPYWALAVIVCSVAMAAIAIGKYAIDTPQDDGR